MRAVETLRHVLSLVVRVDDHFSGEPWPAEVDVALSAAGPAVEARSRRSTRHSDGTYRFIGVAPGPHVLTVDSPDRSGFTWAPSVGVVVPLASPVTPIVVEMWPTPQARLPTSTVVIRGRLVTATAGQVVRMEVVGAAPRNRMTRCDDDGEFVFVVLGSVVLDASSRVVLEVEVPGRAVDSIQVLDGDTNPTVAGNTVAVPPGGETRARINLV